LFGQASRVAAQGRTVTVAVIGFVKAEDCRAIDAEQVRLVIRFVKPVEVDEQVHDPVSEPVVHGPHTCVHHPAKIERGCR
jgi:hypothetical protein